MALFGTDGARGVANRELTPDLALDIGRAAAALLPAGAVVAVATDTRLSGPMLEAAVAAGLTSAGVEVLRLGVLPTPALAHLLPELGCAAGVMISASHNPPEYNGIKLLDGQGRKWAPEREAAVEDRIRRRDWPQDPGRLGSVRDRSGDAAERYRSWLVDLFRGRVPAGLTVVVDVGQGAAVTTAPAVLERLGLTVRVLNGEGDGARINVGCGATHPRGLQAAVLAEGADLGLAFDGDADRLIAVDGEGALVDGDSALYILGRGLQAEGALPGNRVVATVMTNLGVERALAASGIALERTPVGDRWVAEVLRREGLALGGEQSGHVILARWANTGDGLLTALALLAEMARTGLSLADLHRGVTRYPQVLKNLRLPPGTLPGRLPPALAEAVAAAEAELGRDGRVLVRPSGTEPVLRIMLEGRDADRIAWWADRLVAVAKEALESAGASAR
ncbi:MAG: phosphoglucosamine mutase [Firmicutes bacterium]|nr:phosphoglucosamine mutase [Bacillota bacterium]